MSLTGRGMRSGSSSGGTTAPPVPPSLKAFLTQDLEAMTRDELILCIQHARDKIYDQHCILEQRDDELHR
jgi:hypothetical protein